MNAQFWRRSFPLAAAVLIVGVAWTEAPSQEKGEPKSKELRVLFIGNSLTYFNDLPRIVEALADSAPKDQPRIKASLATSAGCMLEGHLPANRMGKQKYDAVVLQEGIYSSPDGFDKYAANFNKYAPLCHEQIEKNGSKTVLFCTASISRLYPKAFLEMHDLQVAMGKKLKVPVAAGGKAWLSYWGDDPAPEQRLALYDPDKTHPSNKGSYIYACSLYAALTGYTPVGLTNRLPKQPEDTITPAEAKRFQEAA